MIDNLRAAQEAVAAQVQEERRIREEKESLQRQLIRQERLAAIGVLVSGVAHELNNPLQAILGFAELLQLHEDLPDGVRRDLELIRRESTRASGIIRNLQRFGRQTSEPSPVRLSDVVASVLELRQRKIEEQGIRLDIEDQSEAYVSAVFTELQQVVLNFVINAEQAVRDLPPERRRVLIRTSDGRNSARLEVEDHGDGVPPADEPKLFQPFFTTKPVGEGTGLGLSVSYGSSPRTGRDRLPPRASRRRHLLFRAADAMTERLHTPTPAAAGSRRPWSAAGLREAGDGTFAVVLDRTAFYPTSGGQPFDTGTLGAARVIDVVDEEAAIVHVTDAPLGDGARGGGHRLGAPARPHAAAHRPARAVGGLRPLFDNRTESFHLGADGCTIDLAREVSAGQVADAVSEANRVVWEDRPVAVRFVSDDEAATLPLRKAPSREGRLRLVEVEDFDLSACGGTHVPRTGGIGIITVSRWERFRGGSRVEFLCGDRVRHRFDTWRDALAATMTHLSVAPGELAGAVERLQGENKALQRALREARERLAAFEARALVERGIRIGPRVVVAEVVADADAVVLKAMAAAAARGRRGRRAVWRRHAGAGGDGAARRCGRRCRGRPQGAGGEVWR